MDMMWINDERKTRVELNEPSPLGIGRRVETGVQFTNSKINHVERYKMYSNWKIPWRNISALCSDVGRQQYFSSYSKPKWYIFNYNNQN